MHFLDKEGIRIHIMREGFKHWIFLQNDFVKKQEACRDFGKYVCDYGIVLEKWTIFTGSGGIYACFRNSEDLMTFRLQAGV